MATVTPNSFSYSSASVSGLSAYGDASPSISRFFAASIACCAEIKSEVGGGGGEGEITPSKHDFAFLRFSVRRFVKAHADRYSECEASAFSRPASRPKNDAVGTGVHGSASASKCTNDESEAGE